MDFLICDLTRMCYLRVVDVDSIQGDGNYNALYCFINHGYVLL